MEDDDEDLESRRFCIPTKSWEEGLVIVIWGGGEGVPDPCNPPGAVENLCLVGVPLTACPLMDEEDVAVDARDKTGDTDPLAPCKPLSFSFGSLFSLSLLPILNSLDVFFLNRVPLPSFFSKRAPGIPSPTASPIVCPFSDIAACELDEEEAFVEAVTDR